MVVRSTEMGGAHVEYPCLACNYICDNPVQILNHYEKKHNIDLEYRAENVHEAAFEPKFGCPFCHFLCEKDVDLILEHYEEVHELYLRLDDGDTVVEDKTAKVEAEMKKKRPSTSSAPAATRTAGGGGSYVQRGRRQRARRRSGSSDSTEDGGRSPPRVIDKQNYRISGEILHKMYELTELMKNVFHNSQ